MATTKATWIGAVLMAAGVVFSAAESEVRSLSTDRPDATESPYTVDRGFFQMELEMLRVTRDGGDRSYGIGEMNLKYGLTEQSDLQWVFPAYEHFESGAEGYGDMQIRFKQNLWGNDGGNTALALMPFVQLPTGSTGITGGEYEGGLILPYAIEGAMGWGYGLQAEIDLVADEVGKGHHFEFLASAAAGRDLTDSLGFFIECVGIVGEGSEAGTEAYFNTGLTYAITETMQLDTGIRTGLTHDAEDFSYFVGFSTKF